MTGRRHLVWFERAILSDLVPEVEASMHVLGPPPASDPFAGIAEAEGVVASTYTYAGDDMDRAPGLRVIARTGIGYDKVDLGAATARGIAVCNTPDGPTVSTAEHAVALILASAKDVLVSAAALKTGSDDLYAAHQAVELDGKVLGLVGYGRIARRVGVAMESLGMSIHAYDPYVADDAFPATVTRHADRAGLFAAADVLSVHVPLSLESAHTFDARAFAEMKPGVIFVNTARGGLVDQEALIAALDGGQVRSAGLDVTDPEPLPGDHPLLNRTDVLVTPHVASGTVEGKRRIFRMALQQVRMALEGERPSHLVNAEVWNRMAARGAGAP